MPLPFILGGLAMFVGLMLLGALLEAFKGKHIAVLGTTAVGKSTFFHFLETGEINKRHTATQYMTEKKEIDIEGVKFTFNDVSGAIDDSIQDWKELVNKSGYIIYLLNIDQVLKKDKKTITNIENDLNKIAQSIRQRANNEGVKVSLVAIHSDKQPEYRKNPSHFKTVVRHHPVISKAFLEFSGTENVNLYVGSLATTKEAEKLAKKIFAKENA